MSGGLEAFVSSSHMNDVPNQTIGFSPREKRPDTALQVLAYSIKIHMMADTGYRARISRTAVNLGVSPCLETIVYLLDF